MVFVHNPGLCVRIAKRLCQSERLDWDKDGEYLCSLVADAERRLAASQQICTPDNPIGWEMAVFAASHSAVRIFAARLAGAPQSPAGSTRRSSTELSSAVRKNRTS